MMEWLFRVYMDALNIIIICMISTPEALEMAFTTGNSSDMYELELSVVVDP